jgi:hypothetical protein
MKNRRKVKPRFQNLSRICQVDKDKELPFEKGIREIK